MFVKQTVDELFEKYDYDKSGAIGKKEAKELVKECLGMSSIDDDLWDEYLSNIDLDNSGTLDKIELTIFLMKLNNKED